MSNRAQVMLALADDAALARLVIDPRAHHRGAAAGGRRDDAELIRWSEWVCKKEAQALPAPSSKSNEILSLKPGMWGFSVDPKELWRKGKRW